MSTVAGSARFTPSPIFGALVGVTVVLGALLWRGEDLGGVGVFAFVLAGWTVSLALHEFAHALVAYIGGDRSVADKGYLTLDVRRYAEPGLSLLFPLLILVIGGIGLPGGAVWINTGVIRSRNMLSAMSAAGPFANLVCAAVCLLPLNLGLLDDASPSFVNGLVFLGAVQVIALVLNLIPIPGLDGFGILEPHLSPETRRALHPVRQWGLFALIAALWFVPAVSDVFWGITDTISEFFGGSQADRLRLTGWREFRFWE